MYFLSKFLPLFFMPLGASLLGFILSLLIKSKKLFILNFIILYFSSIGITSNYLISYVEKPYKFIPISEVKKTNYIIVLSGMREFSRQNQEIIEWKDPDRFFAGVRLFKAGKSQKIIFTSGYNPFFGDDIFEGDLNKKDAIEMGIQSKDIIISGKANNTYEEAEQIRKIFNDRSFLGNEIILITSAFHMQRAKTIFERKGFKVFEYPVDFQPKCKVNKYIDNIYCLIPNVDNLYYTSKAIREIIGRFFYKTI